VEDGAASQAAPASAAPASPGPASDVAPASSPRPASGGPESPPSSRIAIGTTRNFDVDDAFNLDLRDLGGGARWLEPVKRRVEAFNRLPPGQKSAQLFAGMVRYGPYALVALLPVFALLLQLAYLGRARRYPDRPRLYAAHLVFATHSEAFAALALIAILLVPISAVRWAIATWMAVYLVWSMHAVYGGRWIGTAARALVLALVYMICYGFAMAGLVVAAIALG
jgi:hypothetical protein